MTDDTPAQARLSIAEAREVERNVLRMPDGREVDLADQKAVEAATDEIVEELADIVWRLCDQFGWERTAANAERIDGSVYALITQARDTVAVGALVRAIGDGHDRIRELEVELKAMRRLFDVTGRRMAKQRKHITDLIAILIAKNGGARRAPQPAAADHRANGDGDPA